MKLFQTKQNLKPVLRDSFGLKTPLGICQSEYEANGRIMLLPQKIEQTEKGILFAVWEDSFCLMECIIVPFVPTLAENMYIDGCFGFIWRAAIKRETFISWKCYLISSLEGSCETGEGLISCIFEEKSLALSIGTEDEEKLISRAEKNLWMPNNLKDHINEKNVSCLRNGLELSFNQLLSGDYIQAQFLIAWSTAVNCTICTWTAVDQSYKNILKQAAFF